MPRRVRLAVPQILMGIALAMASCARPDVDPAAFTEDPTRQVAASPLAGPSAPSTRALAPPAGCRPDSEWSCTQQQRFTAASAYIDRTVSATGYLGVVFTDRQTGMTWRYGPTRHAGWTASTIKLAIATDLLRRQRAGEITLSAADRRDMAGMLHSSDNAASDRLWARFGGEDMLARFQRHAGRRRARHQRCGRPAFRRTGPRPRQGARSRRITRHQSPPPRQPG